MIPEVTIAVVNFHALHALELMWESFLAHHERDSVSLWIWDNGSTDGAREYGKSIANRFFDGPCVTHGKALDMMALTCESPYFLTADNDIEFHQSVLDGLKHHYELSRIFCVCPSQRYEMGTVEIMGKMCIGQKRIDPCCAFFHTDRLKRLLRNFSFSSYISPDQRQFYDTGSILYHAAYAAGYWVLEAEWLWECITHFGGITLGLRAQEGTEAWNLGQERYRQIKERLALLRGAAAPPSCAL